MDIARYEKARPAFRADVMRDKELRRVRVGEHFSFLFENHLSVLYQVQEMMRAERIVEEAAIDHEIKTYNELIPPPGGLSATLLIEYETRELREEHLPRLLGLEKHVRFAVGDLPPAAGVFAAAQIGETRLSSVQYVTFMLDERQRRGWMAAAEASALRLVVDHPHFDAATALAVPVAEALARDFS